MNRFLIPGIVMLLVILTAGLGYFIFQNQQIIKNLDSKSPSPQASATSPSPKTSPQQEQQQTSPSPALTLAATQNAIKTNIATQTYQNLTEYMTSPVNVILEATECCGKITPQETSEQMSYINEGAPFDFNQNGEIQTALKTKNPQLANLFIGISQNKEHMVAFGINAQNKIESVLMSVSWKLYSY